MNELDVLVVGGGISGLSTLYALSRGGPPVRAALIEAAPTLGGTIGTDRIDGFTIDRGPDSFVAMKPQGKALCEAVGLGGDMVAPEESARKVFLRGKNGLSSMPDGMVLGFPTSIPAFMKSDFISFGAKLRMGMDLVLPRGDGREESIAQFIGRRFGQAAVEAIAEPLLAGIHSGLASELSMNANFPQIVQLEQKYRSVIRGLRKTAQTGHGKGKGRATAFWSLRGGMSTLIDAVAARLPAGAVRTGVAAAAVARAPGGYRVTLSDGSTVTTRTVVLAIRSHVACKLVENLSADYAAAIAAIDYASSAVVFLAYNREQVEHPLDAFGFVSRPGTGSVGAGTFVSSKLANRAPDGKVLLRAFLGGARDTEVLKGTDTDLVEVTRKEMGELLGLSGPPLFSRVYRYDRGTPQLRVGHQAKLATLRTLEEAEGGVFVVGGGYEGVGIPECIRQGEWTAGRARARLGLASPETKPGA